MMQHGQSSTASRAGTAASKQSQERAASCQAGVSPVLCDQRAPAALRSCGPPSWLALSLAGNLPIKQLHVY